MSEVQRNFLVAHWPLGDVERVDFRTHDARECANDKNCCLHKPSDHPLKDAELLWRGDRSPQIMERLCSHGIGHPDPDAMNHLLTLLGSDGDARFNLSAHGCDGCC